MKKQTVLALVSVLMLFLLSAIHADAQPEPPPPLDIEQASAIDPAPAADVKPAPDGVAEAVSGIVARYPVLASVLMIVGLLRLIIKPVIEFLRARVAATPDTADDERLARIESSWWWRALLFILDWGASIKPIK